MIVTIILVLSLLAIALKYIGIWWKKRIECLQDIPGPKGAPILGNMLQIDNLKPHSSMLNWAYEFGSMFCFRVLGKPHLVINDPKLLYEAMVQRGDAFSGRPYMYRADFSFCQGQNVAFQTFNPRWKILRKEVHKSVKQFGTGLKRLESISVASINEMLDKFETYNGEAFDPRMDLYRTFTNIMCTLILGERLEEGSTMVDQVIAMERAYSDGFSGAGDGMLLDAMPWLRHFGNESYKILTKAVETRDKLWAMYIPKLKATLQEGKERGIADALLIAQKQHVDKNGEPIINDESLKMALTDVINGGTTTTTATLYAFLNILLHYPEVQKKLRDEILSVVNTDKIVAFADKENLPYVRATVFELLRYTTIGSLGLPHETIADTYLGGHKIPAGTYCIPNLWAAHHDESHYADPWEFKPERFLDDEGLLLPADHPTRKWFMPFGAGSRVCVGEQLAINRLFLAVVALIQRYEFSIPENGEMTPCDPRTYDFGGLLNPLSYKIRLTPVSMAGYRCSERA